MKNLKGILVILILNFVFLKEFSELENRGKNKVMKYMINECYEHLNNTEWMKLRKNIDNVHRLYTLQTTKYTREEYLRILRTDIFMKEFAKRHSQDHIKIAGHSKLENYFYERYLNSRESFDEIHRDPSRIKRDYKNMKDVNEDFINESLKKFNEKKEKDKKCHDDLINGQNYKIELNEKLEKIYNEIMSEYYKRNK